MKPCVRWLSRTGAAGCSRCCISAACAFQRSVARPWGFFYRSSADGKGRWWLDVMDKGKKSRLVPATEELVIESMRYRSSLGLPPLPSGEDQTPLLLPLVGAVKLMARTAVHGILKAVMKSIASRIRERGGPEAEAAAAHIELASTHWVRYTAGSHQSNAMNLKAVRDNLGHSNIATTNAYVHSEDDSWHDATSAVHRVGWSSNEPGWLTFIIGLAAVCVHQASACDAPHARSRYQLCVWAPILDERAMKNPAHGAVVPFLVSGFGVDASRPRLRRIGGRAGEALRDAKPLASDRPAIAKLCIQNMPCLRYHSAKICGIALHEVGV